MLKVYSQPGCHACEDTKAYLARHDVPFQDIDITKDHSAIHELERLGSKSTPTVVNGENFWIGHQVEKLAKLHA